jgi:hypothetical protein
MSETLTTGIARRLGEIGLNKDAVRLFERWRKMAGRSVRLTHSCLNRNKADFLLH